jgi:DNA-binding transcriptional MerR regulator
MITREDYRGPLTKAAQAMFARADRQRGLASAALPARPKRPGRPSASAAVRALAEVGMTRSRLRQWEDFGVIQLRRGIGRHRIVDARVIENLRLIFALRAKGFTLGEIAALSPEGAPTLETLRVHLARLQAEWARPIRAYSSVVSTPCHHQAQSSVRRGALPPPSGRRDQGHGFVGAAGAPGR